MTLFSGTALKTWICLILACGLPGWISNYTKACGPQSSTDQDLTLVVMDPLCDRLACDCVEGYAQRKYEVLGEFLQARLGRRVHVFWGESVQAALEDERQKTADLVIGKHSVVENWARSQQQKLRPIAQLTGADGRVTQTGLIVVRKDDPAIQVEDLKDYRIFFGPEDCDEKHKAPMALLRQHGVAIPGKLEISGACSEAATRLVELDNNVRAAAVISSYAEPLLAGFGTIEKGELRVIGISDEVPFVTAFVDVKLPQGLQSEIKAALLATANQDEVKTALQSAGGFADIRRNASSQKSSTSRVPQPHDDGRKDSNTKKN